MADYLTLHLSEKINYIKTREGLIDTKNRIGRNNINGSG